MITDVFDYYYRIMMVDCWAGTGSVLCGVALDVVLAEADT